LARTFLANLRPPPMSIVDGNGAASIERVCCLRAGGVSRLSVSLPVDAATARRFAATCHLETVWGRVGVPLVLAIAVVGLVPGVIGTLRHDLSILLVAGLVEFSVAITTLVVRSVLTLRRSRHHPVLLGRDHVLVRGVERETARAWVSLNPTGTVEIVG
jgi:hypothetical protein